MILTDRYGNIRSRRKSGHGAIKRSQAAGSRARKAAAVRRLRRTPAR